MTLQWTIVSAFLYLEVLAVVLLVLPVFSVQRWRRIFRSRLLSRLDAWGNVYFNVFFGLLVLAVIDAFRGGQKHASEAAQLDEKTNPHGHALCLMRMFRAQRNLYIAGGALLLWVVLKWMVRSVTQRALIDADLLAAQRQADSATSAAKRLMEMGNAAAAGDEAVDAGEVKKLRERLAEAEADLRRANASLEAMTAQGASAGRAFDELAEVNKRLEMKLASLNKGDAPEEDKKDA